GGRPATAAQPRRRTESMIAMQNELEMAELIGDLVAVLVELGAVETRAGGFVIGPTWGGIVTEFLDADRRQPVTETLSTVLKGRAAEHFAHAEHLRRYAARP